MAILRDRLPELTGGDADRVAGAVGDLALAVAQAAGYMTDVGMPAGDYVALLESRTAEVMRAGRPVTYPRPLAAVTQLALEHLRAEHTAAAEVVVLCAFLAPEPVPAEWFPRAGAVLPVPLARKAADPVAWHEVLAAAGRSGLARLGNGELQMHRLTRAVIRGLLSARQAAAARSRATEILVASHSPLSRRGALAPAAWPEWARLLPHLLALDPASSGSPQLREHARHAVWYLVKRGDARAGRDLALHLHEQWQQLLGPDHPDTLDAQYLLAFALSELGRYQEACDLYEDTLARRRRVLGENHPESLFAANSLALQLIELGDKQAARDLLADALSRMRQAHGDDILVTSGFASNLARALFDLGETDAARRLHEAALTGFRQAVGDDHPSTIECAMDLARDMQELGQAGAARHLHEDALARNRRVLGDDHPQTLRCVEELAADLRAAGDTHTAHKLDEKALAGYLKILGDDHPRTLKVARRLKDEKTASETPETG